MKCCVYSRLFYDLPYINYFIDHYLNLGFDKIFLLHADNLTYDIPLKFKDKIFIKKVKNTGDDMLREHGSLIKQSGMDWSLCVDCDEFLLLNKNFKGIKDFISKKDKNNDLSLFNFRWGMVEKFDCFKVKNLNELLTSYNIFSSPLLKSMVKVQDLEHYVKSHVPKTKPNTKKYYEGNVLNNHPPRSKINSNSYEESFLLHVHTISIKSMILKSLITLFLGKNIHSPSGFKNLLKKHQQLNDVDLLKTFWDCIGGKAKLPFTHSKQKIVRSDIFDCFKVFDSDFELINPDIESDILFKELDSHNINPADFINFEDRLSKIIFSRKIFHKKHLVT